MVPEERMKILRATDSRLLAREATRGLRRGDVIAFPTETTYGLGCDPRNAKAVARIFRIKGRAKTKSLPLVAASVAQVRRIAMLSAGARWLASRRWPGPLTLVLPIRQMRLAKGIALRGEVAVRVSSSPFVRAVCQAYGFPIVATSANRSGESDCRSGRSVAQAFQSKKHQPDLVIDLGALPRRKPSTVARVREDGSIEVLRQGSIRLPR